MPDYEFPCVSAFLSTEMDARAIKSAMELGIFDALTAGAAVSLPSFAAERPVNPVGLRLLIDLLEVNGVVARTGDLVELTPAFRAVLRFRDLLESRIAFADLVWPDIHTLFTYLLTDLPQFMARSKVFDLFRYDRCLEVTPENLQAASAWTRFTTVLTKYESAAALDMLDLASTETFIDLGGNTGEFARQVCERNPNIRATVVDLPVVCTLGHGHLASHADRSVAERVSFFPTDMRCGELPAPADVVSFKSVLHDWPDADAGRLLERAYSLIRPGGRLVIFEREPISMRGKRIPYVMASDLVFFHFLRPADLYLNKIEELGLTLLEHSRVDLDVGFQFIVARRPQ
jgi:SAM-dependent methyltransferase